MQVEFINTPWNDFTGWANARPVPEVSEYERNKQYGSRPSAAITSFTIQRTASEATYDDFGLVNLTIYTNQGTDIVYLTERARVTR